MNATLEKRLWDKIIASDDCLLFIASLAPNGYGKIRLGGRHSKFEYVHRLVYELTIGDIPKDLQLDHLCRTRNCVNPNHLEPVSSLENCLRGFAHTKKYCKREHLLSGENLYIDSQNHRQCRSCLKIRRSK